MSDDGALGPADPQAGERPPRADAPRSGASPARLAAARALLALEESPVHLEDALEHALPPRTGQGGDPDRELAWFLAYGVERRRSRVDGALRAHVSRPLADLDPKVRVALRLGAFEALFARTRRHAVVHQAVEVVRALGFGRAHGLVNAVVRKVAPVQGLARSEGLDHPAWLVARWDDRYGTEATDRWCEANGEVPPLFLVAAPGTPAPADGVPAVVAGEVVPDVWRVPPQDPARRPDFARMWVQDAAAVRVCDLLGDVNGLSVLDACAAPGGKTLRLLSRGANVFAVDREPRRLRRVVGGAERLGWTDRLRTRVVDWTRDAGPTDLFDAVLVDAPCTGLGTVRRHPEIRWRRVEPDLYTAAELQMRILTGAARAVLPGGVLVYGVCSAEPEEGEEVVRAFLARTPDFSLDTQVSSAPPVDGEDAHYGARMVRRRM